MNKAEYLKELNNKLIDCSDDYKQCIIDDLDEYFTESILSGISEDEIIREIGSVDELVKTLNEKYGDDIEEDFGAQFYHDGKIADFVYEYKNQHILEINGSLSDIKLNYGEELLINFNESIYNVGYTFDKIVISENYHKNILSKIFTMANRDIVVTIPSTVDEVNIKSSLGNVKINKVNLLTVDLKSTMGDIIIKKSNIDNTIINTKAGDVKLEGTYNKLFINTTIGDVKIKNKGDLFTRIETGVGNVVVNLDNNSNGFRFRGNTKLGDIKLKYNKLHLKKSGLLEYMYGNELSDLNISTNTGDIVIK